MRIHRWKRVEALVAVDSDNWVRGIVIADGDGRMYAGLLDSPTYTLVDSEKSGKQFVSERLREGKA